MKQPKWNDHDYEMLIRHYQDKTGIRHFTPLAIAKWAEQEKYSMPVPPTAIELLARGIANAATRAKERDKNGSFLYRVHLAVKMLIGGEKQTVYFDADGPAASEEKIIQSAFARREHALNVGVSATATLEHWYQEHPSATRQHVDFNLDDEIRWRMNLPREEGEEGEGEGEKSG